jgi:Fic family protein
MPPSLLRKTGDFGVQVLGGEPVRTYVPLPLPPRPPLSLSDEDLDLLERANRALGRLDGVSHLLPDPDLFLYFYVRKEAVLSSQIEGTQSSLSDLLLFESERAPGVPLDDVQEVSRYVAAADHGLKRLGEGFPMSLRLIREVHAHLLAGGRGSEKEPGEFRRSQNWIGGSRPGNAFFVPPPPERLMECLDALEKFIHGQPERTPTLLKAALVHVQFETIHPFLDGNGRVGRLLITLLLCSEGALTAPLLYLSLYFKENRDTYYELLQRVRIEGDWESWTRFFLEGVERTANQAVRTATSIRALIASDREKVARLGRAAGSALRLHEHMQRHPIFAVGPAAKALGLSDPTVRASVTALEKLGIVGELTGKQRDRWFSYKRYLDVIGES